MTEPANAEILTWLDCDHCGSVAIESPDGMFTDGDGGACVSCSYPGHVSCDSENEPWWCASDDPKDKCTQDDCEECKCD